MERFVGIFAAGLALFFVAFLVLGQTPVEPGVSGKQVGIFSGSIGQIGFITENFRHIPLGRFSAGYFIDEKTIETGDEIAIKNGIFSDNEKIISFSGIDTAKATLSFDIADSNFYGDLIVDLNGVELFYGKPSLKKYTFEIYDLNSSNELKIKAASSGFKFWAPTTYIIDNLELTADIFGLNEKTIPVELSAQEITGWSSGRLNFYVTGGDQTGNLIIKVNNRVIYEQAPVVRSADYYIDFSGNASQIRPGENLITFTTDGTGKYTLENVVLTAFYYGEGRSNAVIKDFELKSSDYNKLEKNKTYGEIRFFVENAYIDSGIDVYLNSRALRVPGPKTNEWNTVIFNYGDVLEGENKLRFSTRGSYKIGDVNINIIDNSTKKGWLW